MIDLNCGLIQVLGWVCFLVFGGKILCYCWYLFRTYFLTKVGFRKNLKEYGEWAVVTGATDGIGKEYARQLAQQGLKVCLISRTQAKLDAVSKEIEEAFGVETKTIAFDFSKPDYQNYDVIGESIRDLDVGILINNVGVFSSSLSPFDKITSSENVAMLNVNITSDVCMTHMVLQKMIEKNKGVIVHVCSGSIQRALPKLGIYSGSKLFIKRFVNTLQKEAILRAGNNNNIHHQLLIPHYVSTKMSKREPAFTIPSSEEYVNTAIRTIGVAEETNGYFSHELVSLIGQLIPDFILFAILYAPSGSKSE